MLNLLIEGEVYDPPIALPTNPVGKDVGGLLIKYNELLRALFHEQRMYLNGVVLEMVMTKLYQKTIKDNEDIFFPKLRDEKLKQVYDDTKTRKITGQFEKGKFGYDSDVLAYAAWLRMLCIEYVALIRLKREQKKTVCWDG